MRHMNPDRSTLILGLAALASLAHPSSGRADSCTGPAIPLAGEETMQFCQVPSGAARIGSESGKPDERPAKVRQFRAFQIAKFTVTQGQYLALIGEEPWKEDGELKMFVKEGANYPAVYVTFAQAKEFAQALGQLDPAAEYRLPTEAEFEYAARAGTTTQYYWGDPFDPKYIYFGEPGSNNPRYPSIVQSCPYGWLTPADYCANPWGLMHMLGNAWQWVADVYVPSYVNAPTDGNVAVENSGYTERAVRGGSWSTYPEDAGCASRNHADPETSTATVGFRLVRVPK
jgi:formylglycine-generating enzyme required for sulfatase activity